MTSRCTLSRVLLLACMLLYGCTDRLLEYADVADFDLKEERIGARTTVAIGGLAFHSALAVGIIDEEKRGEVVSIKIHLVPAGTGLSGRFSHTIDIADDVKEIQFGHVGTAIWKRQ